MYISLGVDDAGSYAGDDALCVPPRKISRVGADAQGQFVCSNWRARSRKLTRSKQIKRLGPFFAALFFRAGKSPAAAIRARRAIWSCKKIPILRVYGLGAGADAP